MSDVVFDLEQAILDCWNVTKDLDHVLNYLEKGSMDPKQYDKVANMLIGIRELYEVKFESAFGLFEEYCKENYALRKAIKEDNVDPDSWLEEYEKRFPADDLQKEYIDDNNDDPLNE